AAGPGFGDDLLPDRIEFIGVGRRVNRSGVDGPLGGDGPLGVFVGERRGEVLKCHGESFYARCVAAGWFALWCQAMRDFSMVDTSAAASASMFLPLARACLTAMKSRGAFAQSAAMIWPLR